MPMPHIVTMHDDETAISFASRLAFANSVPSLAEFAKDFGFNLPNILHGDALAMTTLATLGDVALARLTERIFRAVDISTYHISGHEIGKRHLVLGSSRICPACFRADIGDELTEMSIARAYARIFWQFASARTCPDHLLLLVEPPDGGIICDFIQSWTPWLFEIADGELDQPVQRSASFDAHLVLRLSGGAAQSWAMQFPIDKLGLACELLGALKLYGKDVDINNFANAEQAAATEAGFALLEAGPAALTSLFEKLHKDVGAPQEKLQARYGPLYGWFARGAGKDDAFAPLRDVFRDHVLETWPLAEGDSVLNYRLPERRLHSIRTASRTHDLHAKRLRRLLLDAGHILETDRPDYDVIFSAPEAQELLEQASGAVNFGAAQRRLGMTRSQMAALIDCGLLRPGEGGEKARPRFTEATIQRWCDLFEKYPEPPRFHTLSTVADVASSLGVSTEDILRLLLDGQLSEVCRDKGKDGLAGLLIRKDGAARHFRGIPGKETSKPISTVSGGLRISTTFLLQLARAGHFAPVEVRDDRTNQPVTRLSDEEVALFDSRYVSRRSLSRNGRSAVAVKRKLDALEIVPEFTSADTKEFVYLRIDVETASPSTPSGDQDLCH